MYGWYPPAMAEPKPVSRRMLSALRDQKIFAAAEFCRWMWDTFRITVDQSKVSRWESGQYNLPADMLPYLAEFVGPEVVYGPFTRENGFGVAELPDGELPEESLHLVALGVGIGAGELQKVIAEAVEDMVVTEEEADRAIMHVDRELNRLVGLRKRLMEAKEMARRK